MSTAMKIRILLRPPAIVHLLMAIAPPVHAEMQREVFPVPPVVAAAFRSGGLAAFDPFDPWNGEGAKPARLLTPAAPGDEVPRLPPGVCYDVLPAWTARGFQPQPDTRVFYHQETELLFASFAAEDAAQIRAFCDWPAAMWMNSTDWGEGGVKQVLLRLTTWEVPATGAGGWDFQPVSAEEILALPADARRMIQRQSFVCRGGQRAKGTMLTTAPPNRGRTLSGAVTEAETTVGEDGTTLDLNFAPELLMRLTDGTSVLLSSHFQQLCEWGRPWVLEAGTLPGQPPRRVFQVYETLRVRDNLRSKEVLARHYHLWTGRTLESKLAGRGQDGMTFGAWWFQFDSPLQPGGPEPTPDPPTTLVPELFGNEPVMDVSLALTMAAGLPPGSAEAWQSRSRSRFFVRGSASSLASLRQWLATKEAGRFSVHTALVAARVRLHPPGGGAARTVWQGSVPVRAGQRSAMRMSDGRPAEGDDPPPYLCFLEMEANRLSDPPGPGQSEDDDALSAWNLEAAFEIRPPLVDAPLKMEAQKESGIATGVTLCRALGRTTAGEEVVLTLHLREEKVFVPWWSADPRLDLWWRRQLSRAGK